MRSSRGLAGWLAPWGRQCSRRSRTPARFWWTSTGRSSTTVRSSSRVPMMALLPGELPTSPMVGSRSAMTVSWRRFDGRVPALLARSAGWREPCRAWGHGSLRKSCVRDTDLRPRQAKPWTALHTARGSHLVLPWIQSRENGSVWDIGYNQEKLTCLKVIRSRMTF